MPPVSSGPGWNDPPPMSRFTSKSKGIQKVGPPLPITPSDPIMQPLFGAPISAPAPSYQHQDVMMMQPQYQAPIQQQQQQQPNYYGGGQQQPAFGLK